MNIKLLVEKIGTLLKSKKDWEENYPYSKDTKKYMRQLQLYNDRIRHYSSKLANFGNISIYQITLQYQGKVVRVIFGGETLSDILNYLSYIMPGHTIIKHEQIQTCIFEEI